MLKAVYTKTLSILSKIPLKLWGLSILSGIISIIAVWFSILPIIAIPISYAIQVGMIAIYYKNYTEGITPDAKPLFVAFKDFQTFKHIAGGMCWRTLWMILWSIIPVAGPFIAIYKSIQYSFTPYILFEEPSVRALDALKKSKEYTNGYKGQIFLGIVLPNIIFFIITLILSLLAFIPYVGIIFSIICIVLTIVYALFAPLFFGLIDAGFYDYCKRPAAPIYRAPVTPTYTAPAIPVTPASPAAPATPATPTAPAAPAETVTSAPTVKYCPTCGSANGVDKKFCGKCGAKLQ